MSTSSSSLSSQLKSSKVLSIFNGIISRNQEAMRAFARGDAAGVAAIYDLNCYMMPYGRESVHGREKVQAYIGLDIKEGAKKLLLDTSEVEGTDDWAFERGVYCLDGTRGSETGSYLCIWRKVDGIWYIYHDCFNVIESAQKS